MAENSKMRIINRDIIKYAAMLTMLLNHIAVIFLDYETWVFKVLASVGYFTSVTMCYFLVEGYHYTHSKKKYAVRLLMFAFISEIPYCLALTSDGIIQFRGLNMLFTLFLCFLMILALDKLSSRVLKLIAVIAVILLSSVSDWAFFAPVFTLLFVWARGSKKKTVIAFAAAAVFMGIVDFINVIGYEAETSDIIFILMEMAGIGLLPGICIVCLYNGKRMERGREFSKWFFYLFYPVHLLLLGFIRIKVML